MKRFIYYFCWSLLIVGLVYLGIKLEQSIEAYAQQTYIIYPRLIFNIAFPVIIGLCLRLPKFIAERRNGEIHGFDWPRFLAAGIPAFAVIIVMLLPFIPVEDALLIGLYERIGFTIFQSQLPLTIAGLVLGYMIFDSFKSKPDKRSIHVRW